MTRAERLSGACAGVLALTAIIGYLADAAGFGVAPVPVALLALAAAVAAAWQLPRKQVERPDDVAAWAGSVACVLAVILSIGWPSLLPPGRGPDLTHHLLLVDYIEQHGQLVHDRSLEGSMGEMAHYTPGAHLLAVMAGAVLGVDGLRAFFPLLALCAALTAGFVYLIARRLQLAVPYAICAVLLLFLPAQYFFGAFTHDSFFGQAVATLFAVAAWWALVVYDDDRSAAGAAMFAVFLAATFLAWPVFVGPLVLVYLSIAIGAERKARDVAIAMAPLAAVALIHVAGRLGWVAIVRTSGAVLRPSVESIGWLLPLLALLGIHISIWNRRVRSTIVLLFAIALQAIALFVLATTQGAHTPYMALKMIYLATYPLAVLGALGLSIVRRVAGERDVVLAWVMATVLVLAAARPALNVPRQVPVVDADLYEAGKWVRANVGRTCVDYLVGDAETAYWLHLAVLGNRRASARMQEIDVYDPRRAMGAWITAGDRGYAIADARQLPDEVRSRVEIVRSFGHAVVLRRNGAAPCYDGRL